jgi:leucyl/phenylalanyl-tRNA--protein transferase
MPVYAEAFDAGHAWDADGRLVAGGYSVAIGAAFTFESQFTHEPNASKVGMSVLNGHLANWGFRFNDSKLIGSIWRSVGSQEIPRSEFLTRLAEAVQIPHQTGRWQVEADFDTMSRSQPRA